MKSWRKLNAVSAGPLKLRVHLIVLTAATLLPIIIFTVVIAMFLARREQETFQRGASERTLALLTAVDTELKGAITTLEALATGQRLETGDLQGFHEQLTRVLETRPNWFSIKLALPSGEQVLNVLHPFGAKLPMIRERFSFEQVLQTSKPVVGGVVRDEDAGQYFFRVRVPVVREGVIKYVLSAVIKPETFSELLAQQRLPPDWVGVVLDSNKRFVARTMSPERSVGQPASQSLQVALSQSSEGWFHGATVEGLDVYTPYNRSDFSGWAVALGVPASAVEASLRRSLFSVAFFGVIFLASGIALAWFFSASIAKSINRLSTMAQDLGLGKGPPTSVPPPAAHNDPAPISEVEDVRNALVKANRLIQERSGERDRVEGVLRQVSERLELAQEAASVGSFERDLLTGEIIWSASQEKLYGLAPGKFAGKLEDWAERVHPEDWPAVEAQISYAMKTKASLNLEFRIIRADGEMRWVASQARIFMDEQGNPRRLLGVNIDITERMRAQQALAEQARLLDLSNDAIIIRDVANRIMYWNHGAEELYGWRSDEALGKVTHELLQTEFPEPLHEIENKLHRDHRWSGDVVHRHRDGKPIHVSTRWALDRDPAGQPAAILVTSTAITERKQAEAALARSRDEFERMAATSPDLLFIYDLVNDQNVYVNKRLEAELGYSAEALQGMKDKLTDAFVHPEDLAQVREQYRRFDAAADGEVLEWEFRARHVSGMYRWFHVRATVFDRTDDGRARRIIGHSRDVTASKETEAALKRFNEDLEKSVVEQTAKLMEANTDLLRGMEQRQKLEEQLRQSQKMEAIGTLAGGIAHDFNNILGIILGYTHELLNTNGSQHDNRSQSLEVIASSAERGAKIVKQLLTFARKTGTEHKPTDVNALIREILDILREIFPKNLRFSLNLDPDIPMIEGDHNQLQQALINICLNARDAMPDGGTLAISTRKAPAIEVRDNFAEASGDYVRLVLSDTGHGMDAVTQRRVFEPFFTTKKDAGTGLGLSVVYGIVQSHGGLIDLESESGSGTTIKIFLPIPRQANFFLESQPNDRKQVLSVGQTILVVEDEPHMLELVRLSAEKRGFRVFTARDGEEAVELYQKHWKEIDVVVLDWGLPRLDGRAVFRELKEINPKVTVIGVSGYLDFNLRDQMLKEGVRDFLQKPCTPNEILEKVLSCSPSSENRPGAL
ncbi:MAG TPA: PAS domain-containing protein [Candidatus Binatia bacterium]|nr:PAS domain-containing protein [Candidatus Binatia bacterium]